MTSPSPSPFHNSRCNDILETALAQAGGESAVNASKTLPLEASILTVLTIKMQVITLADRRFSVEDLADQFSLMHRGFCCLIPELYTPAGKAAYGRLAEVFTRDMKDLKNGRL